jgi:RNA polymerase sigma-70 factor (ECF subfamily)
MSDPVSALHTQASLLVRLRDPRDDTSWQTFLTVYAPLIDRYCRRFGLQDADAADVSQEVLAQVARSIRNFQYQPERGRFRDWLGAVVRSKATRLLKKKARDAAGKGGEDPDDRLDQAVAPEADAEWTAEFNARILQVAMERTRPHFDPASWNAFELAWLQQRPATATAQTLGIGVDAVYVAKSRVLKRLREEVLQLAEDLPQLLSP